MIDLLKDKIAVYIVDEDTLGPEDLANLRRLEDDYMKAQKSHKIYSKRKKIFVAILRLKEKAK